MKERVVSLSSFQKEIAVITMHDEVYKNTFTAQFLTDLRDCFEEAEKNPDYKVVILTGFGNYFATGGTKESLLDIQDGKAVFTAPEGQKNIYSLPLDLSLPVIAAMQGHAIGGGMALGLFADFVILSEESIYTASFMKYGFTPGFGSTHIFPAKLGFGLAEEMLMTAKVYHGSDLKRKGIPFDVYPRREVMDKAIELAQLIAEKPRISLITLKNHLVQDIRSKLPEVIEQELKMHEVTFHQEEVRNRIMSLY